jgi:peptidoglycan hydrolase-like protein with peptidoglycan-binding domain
MAVIHVDKPMSVSRPAFRRLWTGVVHLYWRDVDSFRRELAAGASGPAVSKLQALLSEAGVLRGSPSGTYDEATAAAVKTLQKSYGLPVDGDASPLTQIVLYNAAARFERPSLSATEGREREKASP